MRRVSQRRVEDGADAIRSAMLRELEFERRSDGIVIGHRKAPECRRPLRALASSSMLESPPAHEAIGCVKMEE
jgi:hypothetical protein